MTTLKVGRDDAGVVFLQLGKAGKRRVATMRIELEDADVYELAVHLIELVDGRFVAADPPKAEAELEPEPESE